VFLYAERLLMDYDTHVSYFWTVDK
jgi:hypothetical protein